MFRIGFLFFLKQYAEIGATPTLRVSEFLSFAAKLLLAFGITFEMPIFAFFLTRLGLIDYRMMIRHLRYAVLAIFVVAVALTPPDMISPFLARDSIAGALWLEHCGFVSFPDSASGADAGCC